MKKIILALAFLASLLTTAVAQISQSTVATDIQTIIPDNVTGQVTPASVRSILNVLMQSTFQSQGANGLSISGSPSVGYGLVGTGSNGAIWANAGVINVQAAPYNAKGDASQDDGPAFRAAIAACQAGHGFNKIYVPSSYPGYLISSLDPSGLGALVIGDGTNPNSCSIEGEAINTTGGFNGGVNIKLADGMNRPLLYVRSGAGSPVIKNLRLDGNYGGQMGWSGGPSMLLYTVQIEDGAASPEGSIHIYDSWILNGYNGNLYLGLARGGLYCTNSFIQNGGHATTDANVLLNGYDTVFNGCAFGPHAGYGIYVAEGEQYQFANGAVFCNYVGEYIASGKVGYISHVNMNYQYNTTNGIKSVGGSQFAGTSLVSPHQWVNVTFDANNTNVATNNTTCSQQTAGGTASDVLVNNDPFISLISPNFVGNNSNATNPRGYYNIEINDTGSPASRVAVIAPAYNTSSYETAYTNNAALISQRISGTLNFGNVIPSGGSGCTNLIVFYDAGGACGGNYGVGLTGGFLGLLAGGYQIWDVSGTILLDYNQQNPGNWTVRHGEWYTPGMIATSAAPTVAAGQIGYGGTVNAAGSGNCPSTINTSVSTAQAVQGCLVINVAGTARQILLLASP